jgi:hypothetical protein
MAVMMMNFENNHSLEYPPTFIHSSPLPSRTRILPKGI